MNVMNDPFNYGRAIYLLDKLKRFDVELNILDIEISLYKSGKSRYHPNDIRQYIDNIIENIDKTKGELDFLGKLNSMGIDFCLN